MLLVSRSNQPDTSLSPTRQPLPPPSPPLPPHSTYTTTAAILHRLTPSYTISILIIITIVAATTHGCAWLRWLRHNRPGGLGCRDGLAARGVCLSGRVTSLAPVRVRCNHGNQAGNDRAPAKVYVVGNAWANPDNVLAGSQIDITPSTLDHYYDVELADGRIIGLMLYRYGLVSEAQCGQLRVREVLLASLKNKTLIIHGDGSTQGNVTRLNIISCTKTQKYMEKGFPIFLAHVTTKEIEDKSERKRLEDVPIVQDFPEVFPEDLPGLPPTRQVEFQIDLVPGADQ
ncbi:hypothetical protein Tco_1041812 [Tanacetum coccineum]|uniref:Reverse transcriptase domain-containing protein n=1 Tax=Tanacetum coccineum TaxID=301880 RepID=A0ABQ5GJG9_9ASTR